MSVNVDGKGIFVEIVKAIVDAMTPVTKTYNIDTTPCLPSPSIPNFDRYGQICKFRILLIQHRYHPCPTPRESLEHIDVELGF